MRKFLFLFLVLALFALGCGEKAEEAKPEAPDTAAETAASAEAEAPAEAPAPEVEAITLTYSNFFPPTHIQSVLAEEWCREVEARTGGRIKIDYYPGGTLTKAPEAYEGVVQSISDIGMSALAYTRGRFPVMAAVDLPMGYATGVQATAVANGVYAHFMPAELDDTQVMYFHAHGPGQLHTKGKAVHTLEDMQGLTIRATGNSAKVVEALGGTPVAQSMPEAYQSIQKGVVDGGLYPIETNKGWKMAEVVDYGTLTPATGYTTTFFVVMNKDKWNSLPPEVQAVITEINLEWAAKHGQAWDQSDVEGAEYFMELGGEYFELDAAETARWEAAVAPMIDEYAAELDSKGLDGKAVIDSIRQAMQ